MITNISARKLITMSARQLTLLRHKPHLNKNRSAIRRKVKELGPETNRVIGMTNSVVVNGTRVYLTFDEITSSGDLLIMRSTRYACEDFVQRSGLYVACLGSLFDLSDRKLFTVNTLRRTGYKVHEVVVSPGAELKLEVGGEYYSVTVLDAERLLDWVKRKIEVIGDSHASTVFDEEHYPRTLVDCYEVIK